MPKGLACFKFSSSGFCVVEVCHGKEDGRDFYSVIAIEPHNYRYFKRRYRPNETLNVSTLGYELVRGWGQGPTPDVLETLADKHGIEFGVSEGFLNRLISNLDPAPMPLTRDYFTNFASA